MSTMPSFDPEDDFPEIIQRDPELRDLMDDDTMEALKDEERPVLHEDSPTDYGYKGDFWSDR